MRGHGAADHGRRRRQLRRRGGRTRHVKRGATDMRAAATTRATARAWHAAVVAGPRDGVGRSRLGTGSGRAIRSAADASIGQQRSRSARHGFTRRRLCVQARVCVFEWCAVGLQVRGDSGDEERRAMSTRHVDGGGRLADAAGC